MASWTPQSKFTGQLGQGSPHLRRKELKRSLSLG